jgi:predicted nucleic acid-binding protein
MEQYLIDTNVVSAYFSNSIPLVFVQFMDDIINAVPNISIITQIELLCWQTDDATMQKVGDFISESNVLPIETDVISNCVNIRKHKKMKTPDAIIAATAIANGYKLLTNNKVDFTNIKGLKIITFQE